MNGLVGTILQIALVICGAPLLVGVMRQARARLDGRVGAGVLQPARDLRKLLRKEALTPKGTSEVFRLAPLVLFATSLVAATVAPLITARSPLDPIADLFVVIAVLTLGTVALALAGIDTGTAFGGMGASREMTIAALVEPTLLLAVLALSVPAGSTNLGEIVRSTLNEPGRIISPTGALAAAAFAIAIIAETGRLPVDNPSTHLELTMVHEAMVLEYAGPDLALVEWASAMRLTILLGLFANLFFPWGVSTTDGAVALAVGLAALVTKVAVLGVTLALGEAFLAKLRLFRVPELLAGSFGLALIAVAASFFLA